MKKILSLFLAMVMILSLFSLASCSKEPVETDTNEIVPIVEAETKEDPNSVYDAEIKNLNGHEFKFYVRNVNATHLTTNEVYAEALTGETINDAVYKRNSALEKAYNIKITEERNNDVTGSITAALTAGEYIADVIYEKVSRSVTLTTAGLLADMNSIDTLNMKKTWWDQGCYEAMNIAGKTFFAVGDATTMDDRATWVMIFNKERMEEVGLDVPYDTVLKGDWTLDVMYEYMQKTISDKNGDNVITWGDDYFGYNTEPLGIFAHIGSCNTKITNYEADGSISLGDTLSEKFMNTWTAIKPLLTENGYYCTDSAGNFKKGLVTFYGINCGALINMSGYQIEYGVMPYPKYDKNQDKYYNTVDGSTFSALSIPTTAETAPDAVTNGFKDGLEQAGYLLEAYAYYSRDTLTVAFYDQVLMRQTAQDPESRRMIELALENKIYDPAYILRWGTMTNNIVSTCGTPKNNVGTAANWNNITSSYEKDRDRAREQMNNYIETISAY